MKPNPNRILAAMAWFLLFFALQWCYLSALFLYDALDGKLLWFNLPSAIAYCFGAAWLLSLARAQWRFNRASKAAEAAIAAMDNAADRYSEIAFDAAQDQADAAIADMRKAAKRK